MKDLDKNENKNQACDAKRLAAMYMRMSTDHQRYSVDNQSDAIYEYAKNKNLEIIATYADKGKSGLKIEGRDELKRLINDVQTGAAKFKVILVLDITRWGRFQDADESAFYEYTCRNAGIDVEYVAEQFENDGSLGSDLIKSVKRSMAGEYSRELSKKVFAGQCRLIRLGYRQGGPAGFGLRRMLIDESGAQKGELNRGEHKSLQTDRVVLVQGPEEELKWVRWMYDAFIEKNFNEAEIAIYLNQKKVKTDLNRNWTRGTVHQILTNEKYIGNNVFNRTSNKLKARHVVNPPDMWVRADGAFEAIVKPEKFYKAQGILQERNRRFTNEEMLDKLKNLHQKQGLLSGIIIDEQDNMPSSSAYQHRFGSLIRAYQLVGFVPDRDYQYIEINRRLRKFHSKTVEDTILKLQKLGAYVEHDEKSELLYINNELKVSLVICRYFQTKAGTSRWKIRFDRGLEPDVTIAVRMNYSNQSPYDYYLFPSIDIESSIVRLSEHNSSILDHYRFDDLSTFFILAEHVQIKDVA